MSIVSGLSAEPIALPCCSISFPSDPRPRTLGHLREQLIALLGRRQSCAGTPFEGWSRHGHLKHKSHSPWKSREGRQGQRGPRFAGVCLVLDGCQACRVLGSGKDAVFLLIYSFPNFLFPPLSFPLLRS